MTSSYKHRPLALPNSIRVLTLEPATSSKAPIECSLNEVDLDNITPSSSYEALSYVWGERLGTIPILCHGKQLLVTPNCRDALLRLRKSSKRRRLFIDAICIDQRQEPRSLVERENQIALMGRVYEQAHRVIIWFEKTHPVTPGLFKLLRLLSWITRRPQFDSELKSNFIINLRPMNAVLRVIIRLKDFKQNDAAKLENAYNIFLENDWFKRVWTLQEQFLANPKTSIIVCGDQQIKCAAPELVFSQPLSVWASFDNQITWDRTFTRMATIDILRARYRLPLGSQEAPPTISVGLEMLWKTIHNLESTAPQDKLLGIYGIFDRLGSNPIPKPDSAMTVANLFEATTNEIIRITNSLQILCMCTRESCITIGLPSWVPDWVMKRPDVWSGTDMGGYAFIGYKSRHDSKGREGEGGYKATKNTFAVISEPTKLGRLNLVGAIIGKVDFLTVSSTIGPSEAHEDGDVPWRDYTQACRTWCQKVASFSTYCNGCPTINAVAHTLQLEQYEDTVEAMWVGDMPTATGSSAWFDLMIYPDCKSLQAKAIVDELVCHINPDIAPETDRIVLCLLYLMTKQGEGYKMNIPSTRWGNYAIMVLDTGHFARGLYVCKEGDVVALLAGCDFPVALRPDGCGNYRFVAPLYVHGIMYGEAWPEDESTLEEIVLV